MVKVCPYNYLRKLDNGEEKYNEYFMKYNFPLHDFQKWGIHGIIENKHILITAPTGSGKTLPAEFALDFFNNIGKKVIYTTPIKALSNEKYYNFTQKYPHISVGLITGDIKTNPDANVLIMTTEILANKLYQIKNVLNDNSKSNALNFDMDIENELGCVIFDEIHMINDESRGHIWEQSIILLPEHIQIIGLSATLDNPENFANWMENKGSIDKNKEVYLIKKEKRSVPLIHYGFLTANKSINKNIKDKKILGEIEHYLNQPILLQDEKNNFSMQNYYKIDKTLKIFNKYKIVLKRKFVLNKLLEYLVKNDMLPALCYIFSRKQIEICAHEITTDLLEFDSKIPYIIEYECEHIIRKLPNYSEYLNLPEYLNLLDLLRKGIGIHHSGLMPILREMVEILFSKGYIKLLLCTETMSVGINLPVKTTIFTDLKKFNGEIIRNLYSHEYTQASGRAGRLGLDKIGYVFHLNNLFKEIDSISYCNLMANKPQKLVSKFKINYDLLLGLIEIGVNDLSEFAKKSLLNNKLDNIKYELYLELSRLEERIDNLTQLKDLHLFNDYEIVCQYIDLLKHKNFSSNKKFKEINKQIEYLRDNYKNLEQDKNIIIELYKYQEEYNNKMQEFNNLENYFKSEVKKICDLLENNNYIKKNNSSNFELQLKGKIAIQLKEVNSLIFSQLYLENNLNSLSVIELICFFSCFTEIKVIDDIKEIDLNKIKIGNLDENNNLINIIKKTEELYNYYNNYELINNINSGCNYNIQYDLINYIYDWSKCEDIENCKIILQNMQNEKGIFLGEFIKSLLKINNIANEFEKVAEYSGNIEFLDKIKQVPINTLKFVATNQSLYV